MRQAIHTKTQRSELPLKKKKLKIHRENNSPQKIVKSLFAASVMVPLPQVSLQKWRSVGRKQTKRITATNSG